jgi:hypothetical protein
MRSEHPASPADPGLVAVPVTPTEAPIARAVEPLANADADLDSRWDAWRARGAKSDRDTARQMNRVGLAILAMVSAWLVIQLL